MPIPAMKGEIVAAEGTKGNEMYCIAEGTARVTSRIHATEDEERVRIFIEEVFGANGEVINLYEPSQKRMFTKVMRRAKQLALENKARVIAKGNPPARRADGGEVVSYRLLIEDEKVQAAAESTRALVTATQSINSVLEIAKKHGCVQYSGALRITAAAPHGPEIAVMPKDTWPKIHWNSSLYLLCAALRDGVTICRLLNFFLGNTLLPFSTGAGMIGQTVALATNVTGAVVGVTSHVAMTATGKAASVIPESLGGKELQQGVATANDKKEAALGKVFDSSGNASSSPRAQDGLGDAGARKNVELFVDALQDPDQEFNTGDLVVPAIHAGGDAGQHIFAVDDLVEFDRGTPQEQFEKQKRVLNCLVELGLTVSNLPGYVGVCMDELNLGTLQSGEFFGELSLLPLAGGWRHHRTTTATSNSMLYYLTKQKIGWLSDRFLELRHKLHDHAEDYERLQLARAGPESSDSGAGGESKESGEHAHVENDPLHMVQEQLNQQDVKQAEQDAKLAQLEAAVLAVLRVSEGIRDDLIKAGVVPAKS